jgi:hypothetical protein
VPTTGAWHLLNGAARIGIHKVASMLLNKRQITNRINLFNMMKI